MLADEYVVYTAHLDHIGTQVDEGEKQVFNGAYDNAMGVAEPEDYDPVEDPSYLYELDQDGNGTADDHPEAYLDPVLRSAHPG